MAASSFDTVVFDLDGTIADTSPDLAYALNAALQSLGRAPLPLAAIRTMIGHGARALLRNGLAATGGVDDAVLDKAYRVFMDVYAAHICDQTRPYPHIETAWDRLAVRGIAPAVCTNKPAALTHALIDALGWRDRFAAIVSGDTLAVCKPDPAPLRHAIAQAGGGRAIFVGDSIVDVLTAKAAGIACIAVSFGFADRPPGDLGANLVIDSFDMLDDALAIVAAA
ncbi:MAG: HAD-IA family hydrolase [Sphingomonadaceae bacterium]